MTAWTPADLHDAVPESLRSRLPVAVWAMSIRALTFDCYGTLIDWETGILGALAPLFERAGKRMDAAAVIPAYARHEREVESGPYLRYREVLGRVEDALMDEFGLGVPPTCVGGSRCSGDAASTSQEHRPPKTEVGGTASRLAQSLGNWSAFAETPGCLRALKEKYALGVLSNIDDDLFALSAPKLGVELNLLVTAEQVRSYKPGLAHFETALRQLRLRPDQILHVAESRYHDVEPAGGLGFRTCWVRRHAEGADNAASASGPMASGREPDITVRSLGELVRILTSGASA